MIQSGNSLDFSGVYFTFNLLELVWGSKKI